MNLAAMRSPHAPAAYAFSGGLWLLSVLAPPVRRRVLVAAVVTAWLALNGAPPMEDHTLRVALSLLGPLVLYATCAIALASTWEVEADRHHRQSGRAGGGRAEPAHECCPASEVRPTPRTSLGQADVREEQELGVPLIQEPTPLFRGGGTARGWTASRGLPRASLAMPVREREGPGSGWPRLPPDPRPGAPAGTGRALC